MIRKIMYKYFYYRALITERSKQINKGLAKALDAEKCVAKVMLNHPRISHSWVGKRVPDPDKKLAKGEIDVISVAEGGDVFILEVKNWASKIVEVDGDLVQQRLVQAGRSRPVIPKLENKAEYLRRYLSAATNAKWNNIHPLVVLANQNAEPTESVMRLKQVTTMQTLTQAVDALLDVDYSNSKIKLKAIVDEVNNFNEFDSLSYEGGNITFGDIIDLPWGREKYQSISISVERGLLKTLFFGPKFRVIATLWNGTTELLEIDPAQTFVEFNVPWIWKKRNSIPLSHLSEIRYGGCAVSDVPNLKIFETNNSSNLRTKTQASSLTSTIYSKGQKLYERKVLCHLGEKGNVHGLLVELRPKERPGRMNVSRLGSINNTMFNYFYKEGKCIDVEVVEVRTNGDVILGPIKNGDE